MDPVHHPITLSPGVEPSEAPALFIPDRKTGEKASASFRAPPPIAPGALQKHSSYVTSHRTWLPVQNGRTVAAGGRPDARGRPDEGRLKRCLKCGIAIAGTKKTPEKPS